MCKAWDDHKKAGIIEGRRSGIKAGRKAGVKAGVKTGVKAGIAQARREDINKLIEKLSITRKEAMDLLDIPLQDRAACM